MQRRQLTARVVRPGQQHHEPLDSLRTPAELLEEQWRLTTEGLAWSGWTQAPRLDRSSTRVLRAPELHEDPR